MLKLKRAYDTHERDDGRRILVDRLWPRGIRKEEAGIDEWLKDLGPSPELRTWYAHELDKWPEFSRRYLEEVSSPEKRAVLERIAREAKEGTVTLVYSARDTEHNSARLLEDLVRKMMEGLG